LHQKLTVGTAIPKPGSISFEDRVKKTVPYDWGYQAVENVGLVIRETPSCLKPVIWNVMRAQSHTAAEQRKGGESR